MQRAGCLQGALIGETGMQQRGPGVDEPVSPLGSDLVATCVLLVGHMGSSSPALRMQSQLLDHQGSP